MKTLVWSITHFNATPLQPQQPGAAPSGGPKGMREEEVKTFLFTLIFQTFDYQTAPLHSIGHVVKNFSALLLTQASFRDSHLGIYLGKG